VDDRELSASETCCRCFGAELLFRASLVHESVEHLRYEIARALAQVHWHATGDHLELFWRMVETPYDEWQQALKRQPSESQCERKWDRLMKPYLVWYEDALRLIMSGWGFGAPAVGISNG
jgi:hypothetical protein